jgi:5-oxopent-3-ene-1,2,5-tricarboxylate decarboxylase / 2-hydroxyhepta-2,4-diene-1,7-dioate isomerase
MPWVDDAARRVAGEEPSAAPEAALTLAWRQRLSRLSTATLAAQLRRRGHDTVTMDGIRPLRPGSRMVGVARTLRYLPARPDHLAERTRGLNAQKRLIDSIGPGEVVVMDARRNPTAGTVGDILALRAQVRGAAGIVTDGAVRDSAAVAALGIPTFGAGAHPAVLGRRHLPWDIDVDIACGGVLVRPGDLVVGDDDGVVVIPPPLLAELVDDAEEQERQERFITQHVTAGAGLEGLYPLGPHWEQRYAAWRAAELREENHS